MERLTKRVYHEEENYSTIEFQNVEPHELGKIKERLCEYEELGSVEDVAKNKNLVDRIIDNEMCMAKIDRKERERFKDSLVFNSQTLTELGMSLFSKQAEIEDLKRKLKTYENAEEEGLLVRLPKNGETYYCDGKYLSSQYTGEILNFKVNRIDTNFGMTFRGEWDFKFDIDDIGNIVFPTEAEALQALKERE